MRAKLAEDYNTPKKMQTFHKYLPGFTENEIGHILNEENKRGQQLITVLADYVQGEGLPKGAEKIFGKSIKSAMPLIKDLQKGYTLDQFVQAFNSWLDALFMVMRGHNNRLNDPLESDRPACADGAYLGTLKAIGEIRDLNGHSLETGVNVVDCG